MADRPPILLLADPDRLPARDILIQRLAEADHPVEAVPDPEECLRRLERHVSWGAILIVDLLSTLDDPRLIDGYVAFIHRLAPLKLAHELRLIILSPPPEHWPDRMVGSSGIVDAFVRTPVDVALLLRFLERLVTESPPHKPPPR
jgi:hypothetical protein